MFDQHMTQAYIKYDPVSDTKELTKLLDALYLLNNR